MRGSGRHAHPSVRDRPLSHLKTANSHGGHGPSITFSSASSCRTCCRTSSGASVSTARIRACTPPRPLAASGTRRRSVRRGTLRARVLDGEDAAPTHSRDGLGVRRPLGDVARFHEEESVVYTSGVSMTVQISHAPQRNGPRPGASVGGRSRLGTPWFPGPARGSPRIDVLGYGEHRAGAERTRRVIPRAALRELEAQPDDAGVVALRDSPVAHAAPRKTPLPPVTATGRICSLSRS